MPFPTFHENVEDVEYINKGIRRRKRIRKFDMICEVCGDRSTCLHFGAVTCESCKAFFRRSVRNGTHPRFRCASAGCCRITINTRKNCQFCRYQKCLYIGMESRLVMSEEQRAKKKPRMQKQCSSAAAQGSWNLESETLNKMTQEEQLDIKFLQESIYQSCRTYPIRVSFLANRPNKFEVVQVFIIIVQRFVRFSLINEDMASLSKHDQSNLLRRSVMGMCLLRGVACFPTETSLRAFMPTDILNECPHVRIEDFSELVSEELFQSYMDFVVSLHEIVKIDENVLMLLSMILLFSPNAIQLDNCEKVLQFQEKYLLLLQKYLSCQFGKQKVLSKLLAKLSDLRQHIDLYSEFDLRLNKEEADAVRKFMVGIFQENYLPASRSTEEPYTSPNITSTTTIPSSSEHSFFSSKIDHDVFVDNQLKTRSLYNDNIMVPHDNENVHGNIFTVPGGWEQLNQTPTPPPSRTFTLPGKHAVNNFQDPCIQLVPNFDDLHLSQPAHQSSCVTSRENSFLSQAPHGVCKESESSLLVSHNTGLGWHGGEIRCVTGYQTNQFHLL